MQTSLQPEQALGNAWGMLLGQRQQGFGGLEAPTAAAAAGTVGAEKKQSVCSLQSGRTFSAGYIAPHPSIRKDAVDVDGFLQVCLPAHVPRCHAGPAHALTRS